MTELVERVARAILQWTQDDIEDAREAARAALTETSAFFSERACSVEFQADIDYELHTAVAMLDEALK